MAPLMEQRKQISFPKLKYPPLREEGLRTPLQWLRGKTMVDGAEGLWRVYDGIYDLTDFVYLHPGGSDWISLTKGTDITEAFETHHLDATAEIILPRYFVRKATSPRNAPFTFDENGFYKTLKAKVADKLKEIPASEVKKSDLITDSLFIAFIILAPLSCYVLETNWIFGAAAVIGTGVTLSALTIAAHNYFHQKDNWRMYLFNLSGMSYLDWRITHALSHHLHTNTIQDIELSMLEPFLQFHPSLEKPLWAQFAALYFPAVFVFGSLAIMIKGWIATVINLEGKRALIRLPDVIPIVLLLWMWYTGGASLTLTLLVWVALMAVSGFVLLLVGLTAGHHSNTNFFDGDKPRNENPDWGIHQLDTCVERIEYIGNHFQSLTRFGDHALHHLFPTIDHALLKHLYPLFYEHCEKHETQLRTCTVFHALISHCRQLARKTPHDFSKSPPVLARM